MKTLAYKNSDGQKVPIGVFNIETPVVSQSTGQSQKEVMSQKAVTDELDRKANSQDVYTKEEVNNKLGDIDFSNLATLEDISKFIDNAKYNSETENIEFYHGETLIASVSRDEILGDAIKDGMLDDVELIGNDLIFTFNTDADKTAIRVPLTNFINPELFAKKEDVYTKEETDQQIDEKIEEALYELDTNGYEYVDMGEAGIWATCNIGANKPEETGLYFAWGETQGYSTPAEKGGFSWDTYKFGGTINGNQTKYNSSDTLTTLELEDDAAHVNMGGNWRMPTSEEFRKLFEICNTEIVTNYNNSNINGRLFTLKTDISKQLFLPEAGYALNNSISASEGDYWSNSLKDSDISKAYYFNFTVGSINPNGSYYRYVGHSIRAFIPSFPKSEKYLPKSEANNKFEEIDSKITTVYSEDEVVPEMYIEEGGEDIEIYTKKQVDTLLQDGIEATKLKTPIMLWGNEFDGSKSITEKLDVNGNVKAAQFKTSSLSLAGDAIVIDNSSGVFKISQAGITHYTFNNKGNLTIDGVLKVEGNKVAATQEYVDEATKNIDRTLYKVVTEFDPNSTPSEGLENKIILVPNGEEEGDNLYDEYIWKGDKWEKLGSKVGIDLTDVTATKLKLAEPIKLWGQNFDGSNNITGVITPNGIIAASSIFGFDTREGKHIIYLDDSKKSITIGNNDYSVAVNSTITSTNNITAPNISEIESKLEGVTKAADDSEVIKGIYAYDWETSDDIWINPFLNGIELSSSDNSIIYSSIEKHILRINVNTDIIATRDYVDDKINFLVNSEGGLEDSFDTLKEVDTWIKEHEGEAASIIEDINEIKADYIKSTDVANSTKGGILSKTWASNMSYYRFIVGTDFAFEANENNLLFRYNYVSATGDGYVARMTKEFPLATFTTAGVMSAADKAKLDSLEDTSVEIVPSSGDSIEVEPNKYYRFDEEVNNLHITLKEVTDTAKVVSSEILFTTGNTPSITIESENSTTEVNYFSGYSIEPDTTYELNIMFNGVKWIVAYAIVE